MLFPSSIWPAHDPAVFTFDASLAPPLPPLSFPPRPHLRHAPKRCRPLADVDGGGHARKKKRRLRLRLITSRLSRPFSAPPTHIVDRGSSKIAVWARQKAMGRYALRKTAILNCMRVRAEATARAKERERVEASPWGFTAPHLTFPHLHPPLSNPRHHHHGPLPPSPLGLSNNYAALDDEDALDHHHADLAEDAGADGPAPYYSDFSFFDSDTAAAADDNDDDEAEVDVDYWDDLDGVPHSEDPTLLSPPPPPQQHEQRPPTPPDEKLLELQCERARQKECVFVAFA